MSKTLLVVLAAVTASSIFPGSAHAQSGACQVGARVVDRQDRTGVVTEAKGSDCRVKLDNGESRFYLAWMLAAADKARKPEAETAQGGKSAPLATGNYECWAAGGVAGTMRISIRNATTYADSKGVSGKYSLDAESGKFEFDTGPWKGYFGKKLGPKKFGVSSRPGNYYGTTCDLKAGS